MNSNNLIMPKPLNAFNIVSLNANGINDKPKRRNIIHRFKMLKADIIFLVDTRLNKRAEDELKNECDYFVHSTLVDIAARGVSILISKTLDFKLLDKSHDDVGNVISLKTLINNTRYILTCIYAPNRDTPEFYVDIFQVTSGWGEENMIIAGDFNTTLDYDLDNWNYRTRGNEQARIKVNQLIEDYNFLDPLRELRGDAREYTYKSNSGPQRSRLDFFLVSESLRPLIKEANIYHRYLSDHKPIGLKIR